MTTALEPIEILLIEDSPSDRLITIEALRHGDVRSAVHVVENGVEALEYLRGRGKYPAAVLPDLILLDLNLPKKDGREVLAEIKADPTLKYIPVVILTTSAAETDVMHAYGHFANSYITKPVDFHRLARAIETLSNYWFDVVTLPSREAVLAMNSVASPPRPAAALQSDRLLRVLLVEDSSSDRLILQEAFAQSPLQFEVVTASRLADARALLGSQQIDVILTDLNLPDSKGLDTLRLVCSSAGNAPVIVLTGLDDERIGLESLKHGAQDYLVKGDTSPRGIARAARYAIDRKRLERELLQSRRMDALGQLAAGVAHEFNNLLTVIRGHADLLMDVAKDGAARDSAREISRATESGANLTRQLLTFTHQQVIHRRPVDLHDMLGQTAKMLRRILGGQIRLELQMSAATLVVEADPAMLEQIIMNLAINARDAMACGGTLTLETSKIRIDPQQAKQHSGGYAGEFALISMKDTGAGIAPEQLPYIFEPFFTTKDAGKGTGLGLATVHTIVEQHHGWVEVDSRVGEGSIFKVYLPLCMHAVARADDPVPVQPSGGSETVLVVEDDEGVRDVAETILRKNGYQVMSACTGAEALATWNEHREEIDLVFTDLVMPDGMNGLQLAKWLRSTKPDLKIVFTSGYSPELAKQKVDLESGANFLQKPYELSALLAIVRRALSEQ